MIQLKADRDLGPFIPAQAGIQWDVSDLQRNPWVPALSRGRAEGG